MYNKVIWIIGAEGKIGSALAKSLEEEIDTVVISTDKDVDITDLNALEKAAQIYRPSIVINCAGLSDKDYCEAHRSEAYKINTLGARNVASVSRIHNAKIIHFSSDDVFSNDSVVMNNEFDTPLPTSVYGKSKLAGENMVRELNPKHMIIRSSWLYGISERDYYGKVMSYAKKNEEFEAPMDSHSCPTSVSELIKVIKKLINSDEYGIMHVSSTGVTSRYEFAREILRLNGYSEDLVKGIHGSPEYSVLENLMLEISGVHTMPNWKDDLSAFVNENK